MGIKLKRVSANEEAVLAHSATGESIASKHGVVFGFCHGSEAFARSVRQRNPNALWGGAMRGQWALAWRPSNKYLIWHEFLHLLCAEDCYNLDGVIVCEENNCIMQYVPNEDNCNSSLTLCSKVYAEIDKGGCKSGFADDK